MERNFETREIGAQPILGIRVTTTMDNVGEVMGPLFGEVYGYIQQSGHQPVGMPLTIYHAMDNSSIDPERIAGGHGDDPECVQGPGSLEMECAMPVASDMDGAGRIQAGELPAGLAATVTHVGPYDTLPQSWSALTEWMGQEGLEPRGAPWEVYVTDPGAEPDQSKWRTEIFFPVR